MTRIAAAMTTLLRPDRGASVQPARSRGHHPAAAQMFRTPSPSPALQRPARRRPRAARVVDEDRSYRGGITHARVELGRPSRRAEVDRVVRGRSPQPPRPRHGVTASGRRRADDDAMVVDGVRAERRRRRRSARRSHAAPGRPALRRRSCRSTQMRPRHRGRGGLQRRLVGSARSVADLGPCVDHRVRRLRAATAGPTRPAPPSPAGFAARRSMFAVRPGERLGRTVRRAADGVGTRPADYALGLRRPRRARRQRPPVVRERSSLGAVSAAVTRVQRLGRPRQPARPGILSVTPTTARRDCH